jgi:hypothetical protein
MERTYEKISDTESSVFLPFPGTDAVLMEITNYVAGFLDGLRVGNRRKLLYIRKWLLETSKTEFFVNNFRKITEVGKLFRHMADPRLSGSEKFPAD